MLKSKPKMVPKNGVRKPAQKSVALTVASPVSPEMMMTMMAMMLLVMDVDVVDDAGVEVDDYVDVKDHVDGASDDDVDAGAKVIAS